MRLEDQGEDEIAFLAKSFNLMSSRIKRLIENLEESNAARQRLFAHATHEIKSPLTSIKGFVDIIEYMNVLPEAQQKQILPAAKKDLQRVIKIANDLLQLARLRDPQYKFDLKETDLVALLREEHSFFAQRAAANNATATFECSIAGRLTLNTDPDRLSQILDNLWSNGTTWTSHNQTRKSVGDVKIFWQDNCGKMIKELLNHLATIILPTPIILSLIDFVLFKFSVQF